MSHLTIKTELAAGQLVILPLHDFSLPGRYIGFAGATEREPPPSLPFSGFWMNDIRAKSNRSGV